MQVNVLGQHNNTHLLCAPLLLVVWHHHTIGRLSPQSGSCGLVPFVWRERRTKTWWLWEMQLMIFTPWNGNTLKAQLYFVQILQIWLLFCEELSQKATQLATLSWVFGPSQGFYHPVSLLLLWGRSVCSSYMPNTPRWGNMKVEMSSNTWRGCECSIWWPLQWRFLRSCRRSSSRRWWCRL